jgi:hypothetical protein
LILSDDQIKILSDHIHQHHQSHQLQQTAELQLRIAPTLSFLAQTNATKARLGEDAAKPHVKLEEVSLGAISAGNAVP